MTNTKKILVADHDIQITAFLQERIKDKKFHFILATSMEYVVSLLESETFFAAIVDFEMQNITGEKVIDYVLEKKIPTIATFDELTDEQYIEVTNYPVIDYVIKNNLAGKSYLADLLQGLESFYNRHVLICSKDHSSLTTKSITQVFRSLLFQPIITSSKKDALELMRNDECIKIVYVDEELEDKSGLLLCREIKNRYPKRDMILFGGTVINGDTKRVEKLKGEFFKSGVTDFFSESIDKERFNTHIMSMMKILKQKQRLDTYIETVDKYVLVSITNKKGVIVYASDAFSEMSGYSKEELIGRNHNIVRHPDMDSSIYKEMWETIKAGHVWSGELKNRKKSGDFYWVSVAIEPIYDDFGLLMGYQSIRFDITDKKRVEELSIRDKLTGAYNRNKFDDVLNYEFAQRGRYKKELAMIMVDFDHFKNVNDSYGHQAGDHVLVESAKIIESCVRESDSFCRWGGEEFAVICPFTDLEGVLNLAEKIRLAVSNFHFIDIVRQTVSLGVAVAKENDTIEAFLKRSDDALYMAKEMGRNRVMS
ncbi:diguanylate cyclase [Candidatus Sulfurimonas marisnigri]|uniref:Diguanylate cyclase n=1 Tax=Candidatus Sulfurimonas marisnigri TaxID=2740405 RepID=A0A7S7M0N0_9BACT|nr:diguanylate cyclase [Candidatus Sulfurimonas marisnigri]QOY54936.1 diguanylate cyclase [Candidatus Sulfurimonas marisnigri]